MAGRPIAARQLHASTRRQRHLRYSPSSKDTFAKRRCILPAGGFYEWRRPRNNREPLWIHLPDAGLLWFAGLYESWQPEPGQWQRTFTIIMTWPNRLIEPIHDRMPVILGERAAEDWMNPAGDPLRLKSLLVPAPDDQLVLTLRLPLRPGEISCCLDSHRRTQKRRFPKRVSLSWQSSRNHFLTRREGVEKPARRSSRLR